ncbi:MAG: class I SAM-dependent methyltransferase [Streptosporangiaceae bacterium]
MPVDTTGKISLDHIYTQPDPRGYFGTLRKLDYHIPQLAKPYFADLIEEYRQARQVAIPTVLDIGCSYGINAALLKCDVTMEELYGRYSGRAGISRDELLEQDRELTVNDRIRFFGLDTSGPALAYATEAGFLDGAIHADLESTEPTERQRALFAETDLVISTGCLGYVTEKTIAKVVHEGRPWMAHFVLRMFPFDPIAETLAAEGYETVRVDGVFKQRRFATQEEQSLVLDTLSAVGVDPHGLETDGWFYAQLHISRPERGLN